MNIIPIETVLLIESNHEGARLIGEIFNHQEAYSFALPHVESMAEAETYLGGPSIVALSDKADEAIVMHTMASGVQDYFRSENFLESLTAILDETDLHPKCLNLEVSESGLMERANSGALIFKEQNCEEAQGFYFSPPVPAEQFSKLHRMQMVDYDPSEATPLSR
jgi:hypothetical protein